jgi:hypothetical protein
MFPFIPESEITDTIDFGLWVEAADNLVVSVQFPVDIPYECYIFGHVFILGYVFWGMWRTTPPKTD